LGSPKELGVVSGWIGFQPVINRKTGWKPIPHKKGRPRQ
jgi:hypothetical protein